MNARKYDAQRRVQLGRLLVERGVITEAQLEQAILQQRGSAKRLGEILVEQRFATQLQIDKALRKQRNLRLAASVLLTLMAPLHAFGASPVPAEKDARSSRMMALDDEAMADVSGQGLDVRQILQASQQPGSSGVGLDALRKLATALDPLLMALDYNLSIKGVVNGPDGGLSFNKDGSMTVKLDTSIAEISMADIRPKGSSTDFPALGSITMHNVDFSGTQITIRSH